MLVLAIRSDTRKIDKLNQYAAVTASRELCGVRKSGHWQTSHRSCGSILLRRGIHHPQGSEERNRPRPAGEDVPGSEHRSAWATRGKPISAFTYPAKFAAGSDGR